jgi:uncharacterized protein YndB with AHSA1/START domain
MPRARRSREIRTGRGDVWRVVSDPHHLWRWWPKVQRVEDVRERRRGAGTQWTSVLETKSGRTVRADFRCLFSREGEAIAWEQEVEGSPFERVLASAVTKVELRDADGATRVTLEHDQRLRGLSRLGGFMLRRASAEQLDEALDGLVAIVSGPGDGEEPDGGPA